MNPEKPEGEIFRNPENVPDISKIQELREFTRRYSPIARDDLAHKIKLAKVRKELGIIDKDEESESVREMKDQFKERFEDQKNLFAKESLRSRNVEVLSKEKGIIFVHAVPLNTEQEANTQMNNRQVITELMNTEERIGTIINKKPSISCSTLELRGLVKYGVDPYKSMRTMYPFGIVIKKGTILAANRFDSGTVAISRTAKHRKYDRNEPDTSVQPKIDAQIKYSIEGPFSNSNKVDFIKRHGHIDGMNSVGGYRNYNEFTIAEPEISGFFVDEDFINAQESTRRSEYWSEVHTYFEKYSNVPIYIKKDGQVTEFTYKDGQIKQVHVQGLLKEELPEKNLPDYTWASHSHKAEEEAKRYTNKVEISMRNISNLIKEQIITRHDYNTQWIDKILILLKDKSITEDEVYLAVKGDFEGQIERNEQLKRNTKDFIVSENRPSLFNKQSGMYAIYKRTIAMIPKIISDLVNQLKSEGYEDLAESILKIKN